MVAVPSADVSASNAECFMMFHIVLRVFHDVLLVVHDVLLVVHDVLLVVHDVLPRMENWNQDLPERYSKFCGLYIKFQGHGKWPWTW